MRGLISHFVDLPRPVQMGGVLGVGGLAVAAIAENWILLTIIAVVILIVILALLAYRVFLNYRKKRRAQPFEREIRASGTAVPQGVSDVGERAKLDQMRKKFEEGVTKFKERGRDLYTIPWYLFIGESGSGKTEAIRNWGIKHAPGLQNELQGTGGTINMDWWFTDHGVILDTAGAMVLGNIESEQNKEWHELLSMLKKHRGNCPINGLLLAIPVDSLIERDASEIEHTAGKLAREMDLLQRRLGVRFPVYILVTKADKLNGFRQFFREVRDPRAQAQMLGWSNPEPLDVAFDPSTIQNSVEQIIARLDRKRLGLLLDPVHTEDHSARRTDQVDELYAFPQAVRGITSRLQRYLELIFTSGVWSSKPLFLRGIYFTSSMQHGEALDLELAEALGVPVSSLQEAAWTEDKAYFLRDVFQDKVFPEKGLVTDHDNVHKLQRRRRVAVLGAGFAATVILVVIFFFAFQGYRDSLGDKKDFWSKVESITVNSGYSPLVVQDKSTLKYQNQRKSGVVDSYWKKRFKSKSSAVDVDDISFVDILAECSREPGKGVKSNWIINLMEISQGDIEKQEKDAARAIFNRFVISPLIVNARNRFSKQSSDFNWTAVEVAALARLIEIEVQGTISKEFVADELEFLLAKNSEYDRDIEHAGRLGQIWPELYEKEDILKIYEDNNSEVIKQAIGSLVRHWQDHLNGEGGEIEKYKNLLSAIEAFDRAEITLLALNDSAEGEHNIASVYHEEWRRRYDGASLIANAMEELNSAVEKCNFTSIENSPLETAWIEAETAALAEAEKSFHALYKAATGEKLETMPPSDPEIDDSIGLESRSMDISLAEEIKREWNSISFRGQGSSNYRRYESEIDRADRLFLRRSGGDASSPDNHPGHVYQVRSDMYRTVDELFRRSLGPANVSTDTSPEIETTFGDTRNRFDAVNSVLNEASEKLGEFYKRRPDNLPDAEELSQRFLKAKELCDNIRANTARDYLYQSIAGEFAAFIKYLVSSGIAESIKMATESPEEEYTQWESDLPRVPLTRYVSGEKYRKYFPPIAIKLFQDWASITSNEDSLDEASTEALKQYADQYSDYWTTEIFEDLVISADSWSALQSDLSVQSHNSLDDYGYYQFAGELSKLGEFVVNILEKYEDTAKALKGEESTGIKSIQERLHLIQRGLKIDPNYERQYEMVFTSWRNLREDVYKARDKILDSMNGSGMPQDYLLPGGVNRETPSYADGFWRRFGITALRLLTNELTAASDQELQKLDKLYKFPLAPNPRGSQLSAAEVAVAKTRIDRIISNSPSMGETRRVNAPNEVEELLDTLRSPLGDANREKYGKWKYLLDALPASGEQYHAKIYVLPTKRQSDDSMGYASKKWYNLEYSSGRSNSSPKNILDKKRVVLVEEQSYPEAQSITLRFYDQDNPRPISGIKLMGRDNKLREVEFLGSWALLHLLYDCNAQRINENSSIWEAELIIQQEGEAQQYSLWLQIELLDEKNHLPLPPIEKWPGVNNSNVGESR